MGRRDQRASCKGTLYLFILYLFILYLFYFRVYEPSNVKRVLHKMLPAISCGAGSALLALAVGRESSDYLSKRYLCAHARHAASVAGNSKDVTLVFTRPCTGDTGCRCDGVPMPLRVCRKPRG